jgi:hypothetical protein
MTPLELILCGVAILLGIFCFATLLGRVFAYCGRYDDQLSANWKADSTVEGWEHGVITVHYNKDEGNEDAP